MALPDSGLDAGQYLSWRHSRRVRQRHARYLRWMYRRARRQAHFCKQRTGTIVGIVYHGAATASVTGEAGLSGVL